MGPQSSTGLGVKDSVDGSRLAVRKPSITVSRRADSRRPRTALGVAATVRGDRAPRPASGRILQVFVDHEEVALPARAHQEPFELVEPVLLGECGPPEVSSQAPSASGQIVKALQTKEGWRNSRADG